MGYVTRGRGIGVHSVECSNIKNLMFNPERLIEVEWARQVEQVYPVALVIETEDHQGILARLTEVIAKEASNIRQFEAGTTDTGLGRIEVLIEVKNRKHLNRLRQAIHRIKGVLEVSRKKMREGGGS
jgi:GTP pyrophosphokinase